MGDHSLYDVLLACSLFLNVRAAPQRTRIPRARRRRRRPLFHEDDFINLLNTPPLCGPSDIKDVPDFIMDRMSARGRRIREDHADEEQETGDGNDAAGNRNEADGNQARDESSTARPKDPKDADSLAYEAFIEARIVSPREKGIHPGEVTVQAVLEAFGSEGRRWIRWRPREPPSTKISGLLLTRFHRYEQVRASLS